MVPRATVVRCSARKVYTVYLRKADDAKIPQILNALANKGTDGMKRVAAAAVSASNASGGVATQALKPPNASPILNTVAAPAVPASNASALNATQIPQYMAAGAATTSGATPAASAIGQTGGASSGGGSGGGMFGNGIFGLFGTGKKGTGTKPKPIHVALAEPSMGQQIWRAVRVLGSTFLILGFVGVIMEERGVGRGMGLNTDMVPEPEQNEPRTFDDVKGCDEAKGELMEIVEFLRAPEKFTRLGGRLPKGVLLVGPPGTGKTLLARAVAGEAGRPFFYSSGSEFEEMFVGVGARRVRELFNAAKKRSPCIVFIDELDSIAGKRNAKDQSYMKMTLNQLLVELDGFKPSDGIIVIAATNFPESLDNAIVRPGRFDRHVVVPNPDAVGRREILEVHVKNIPLDEDVHLEIIARGTPGFSGADLSNLANMAAIKAATEGFTAVKMSHLEYAKDRILMGAERKSAFISEETRTLTAYHEGGHALVASTTVGALPVHKATIVPRGQALGMVTQLPESDMLSMSRQQMLAKIDVCMGGRAAEELIFGKDHVTSGASSDFEQATQLAEAMVSRYGMSEKLGPVSYDKQSESPETRALIESEVKALLESSYERTMNVLVAKQKELHSLASALLEHESLTGEEVKLAIQGKLKASTENEKSSSSHRNRKARVDNIIVNDPGVLDATGASAQ